MRDNVNVNVNGDGGGGGEEVARARRLQLVMGVATPQKGEGEGALDAAVAALRHWLRRQPHLPSRLAPIIVDEERWLQNYALSHKGSVERAKRGLDEYFSLRWRMPEAFALMADPDMAVRRRSFDNTCLAVMPRLTDEGHRVVVYSHFTPDSTDFDTQELAGRVLAMGELFLSECGWGSECGEAVADQLVLDLNNTRLSHLAKYNLTFMKTLFDHAWKAYPERVAGVHVVNPPARALLDATLALFRPFLKQKMRDRIRIHESVDRLREFMPAECLPADYGGTGPPSRQVNEAWRLKMVEKRELLRAVAAAHRSDERLRPAGKKGVTSWTDLGMEGSFRKLSLD